MPTLGLTQTPSDTIPSPDDAATLQACRGALALVKGEWVFDPDEGVPLFSEILVKAPDLDRIRAIIRRQLLAVQPGLDVLLNDAGDLAIVNGDLVWGTVQQIVDVVVSASFIEAERRVAVTYTAYTAAGLAVRDTFNITG